MLCGPYLKQEWAPSAQTLVLRHTTEAHAQETADSQRFRPQFHARVFHGLHLAAA